MRSLGAPQRPAALGGAAPRRPPPPCLARRRCRGAAPGAAPPPARLATLPHAEPVAAEAAAADASASTPAAAAPAAASTPAAAPAGAPPRRVLIMVEPSPFTYVCGYMNRYRNTIRHLVREGAEVLVVTTGRGMPMPGEVNGRAYVDQPAEFEGARVLSAFAVPCPWYWPLPLSFALSPRLWREIKEFNPEVVHCSSPGVMWLAALVYSRALRAALVLAYHTHVPEYMPRYGITWLVPAMWAVIRFFHGAAHLTLATSGPMAAELAARGAAPAASVAVWRRGVCSDTFHPRFRCAAMRARLAGPGAPPGAPVLLSVGRLGAEKNLDFLKGVLERVPGARLAFVGDGPARADLERTFRGTPTTFVGMLHGADLAAAYASADVFVMPSESETLGFVVLEAMAAGLPVVAVRAGGIPDILCCPRGETGVLYEPGDVEAAAAAVRALAASAEARAAMGAAARAEVGGYDWAAATRHLHRVQYPAAMAAAAAYYGERVRAAADAAAAAGAPAPPLAPAAA